MQPIRITLLTTKVILLTISAIAIACAPADHSRQNQETEKETTTDPTPTPTKEIIYLHNHLGTLIPAEAPPTKPATPFAIPAYFKQAAETYIATKEAQETKGIRSTEEPKSYRVLIIVEAEDIAEITSFLETGGATVTNRSTDSTKYPGKITALVPIPFMLDLEENQKIIEVIELVRPVGHNQRRQTQEQKPSTP